MRLTSLDVFRGIAIAGMILVNNPGSWNHVYPALLHAEWHGYTPTDLVFPFFLFIVGVAMAFSLSKYARENRTLEQHIPRPIYLRIFRRCISLFLLGLALNGFPNYDLSNIRIMGVLQRISLAYLFSTIAIFHLSRKQLWILFIFILLGYWGMIQLIPVPVYGAGNLTPEGNLGAYIDTIILSAEHLWRGGPYDPEGLFSTFPAIATVLMGYLSGDWLKQQPTTTKTSISLIISGLSAVLLGHLCGIFIPINKALWTSSYVLVTAGWALLLLAICYETIEVRGWRRWGYPFKVMGVNSIFLFVASGFFARILNYTYIGNSANAPTTKIWIYQNFFQSWAGYLNGSLFFAVTTVFFWWLILYGMYRKGWFLKV
ncbi:MAG: heparan-alpha-glucosaminide N-acetyltransferase domain-containing protein [Microcoleaceae cyanobacterium]